jgi:SAM-dependent methyltransferase
MKNFLKEPPPTDLHGRLKFTTENFVAVSDVRDKTILNIGCGYGWFELWALKNGVRRITGIEMTDADLETARAFVKDPRAVFQIGSALDAGVPNESCDTVVSWEVIEHIPRQTESKMFSEAHRVLRPGGIFYLSTPNKHWLSILLDPTYWMIDHRHYSIEFLKKLGAGNGLQLSRHEIRAGWLEAFDLWNLYVAKWIFRRQRFFKSGSLAMSDASYRGPGFNTLFAKFQKISQDGEKQFAASLAEPEPVEMTG